MDCVTGMFRLFLSLTAIYLFISDRTGNFFFGDAIKVDIPE